MLSQIQISIRTAGTTNAASTGDPTIAFLDAGSTIYGPEKTLFTDTQSAGELKEVEFTNDCQPIKMKLRTSSTNGWGIFSIKACQGEKCVFPLPEDDFRSDLAGGNPNFEGRGAPQSAGESVGYWLDFPDYAAYEYDIDL